MNRNTSERTAFRDLGRRLGLRAAVVALALLAGLGVHQGSAVTALMAESPPTPQVAAPEQQATRTPQAEQPHTEQLVFSLGVLSAVDDQTVTVSFEDGAPETYRISPQTTIQSQNGDAEKVADLKIGAEVIVLAHDGDPTALTIVNGGDHGFTEAGPADIRGHEHDEVCTPCGGVGAP